MFDIDPLLEMVNIDPLLDVRNVSPEMYKQNLGIGKGLNDECLMLLCWVKECQP